MEESKKMEAKENKKIYTEVKIEAKNNPYGSYAAGCRATYGNDENCYICDYGG